LNINLVAGPVPAALHVFYEMGVKSIFVEGGAEIYTYFMKNFDGFDL
jgi:riboflavin biosynthesis pyrimidine reductase